MVQEERGLDVVPWEGKIWDGMSFIYAASMAPEKQVRF